MTREHEALGILHPGEMGQSIAAAAQHAGQTVFWASAGRSPATRARAERVGLRDAGSLAELCWLCGVIVCVCPPAAAEGVAESVLAAGFRGLYLDANAIAPGRAMRLAKTFTAAGAEFVDGGIIGEPAWEPNTTWLYLSGPRASRAAACFSGGPLETAVLGPAVGQASALKMCYAAYAKGSLALLCATLAAAQGLGVRPALERQWSRDGSGFATQAEARARQATAKAWRFSGEMDEIAATFEAAGLPGGFHQAAAQLFQRLAGFKDAAAQPPLEAVLTELLRAE